MSVGSSSSSGEFRQIIFENLHHEKFKFDLKDGALSFIDSSGKEQTKRTEVKIKGFEFNEVFDRNLLEKIHDVAQKEMLAFISKKAKGLTHDPHQRFEAKWLTEMSESLSKGLEKIIKPEVDQKGSQKTSNAAAAKEQKTSDAQKSSSTSLSSAVASPSSSSRASSSASTSSIEASTRSTTVSSRSSTRKKSTRPATPPPPPVRQEDLHQSLLLKVDALESLRIVLANMTKFLVTEKKYSDIDSKESRQITQVIHNGRRILDTIKSLKDETLHEKVRDLNFSKKLLQLKVRQVEPLEKQIDENLLEIHSEARKEVLKLQKEFKKLGASVEEMKRDKDWSNPDALASTLEAYTKYEEFLDAISKKLQSSTMDLTDQDIVFLDDLMSKKDSIVESIAKERKRQQAAQANPYQQGMRLKKQIEDNLNSVRTKLNTKNWESSWLDDFRSISQSIKDIDLSKKEAVDTQKMKVEQLKALQNKAVALNSDVTERSVKADKSQK